MNRPLDSRQIRPRSFCRVISNYTSFLFDSCIRRLPLPVPFGSCIFVRRGQVDPSAGWQKSWVKSSVSFGKVIACGVRWGQSRLTKSYPRSAAMRRSVGKGKADILQLREPAHSGGCPGRQKASVSRFDGRSTAGHDLAVGVLNGPCPARHRARRSRSPYSKGERMGSRMSPNIPDFRIGSSESGESGLRLAAQPREVAAGGEALEGPPRFLAADPFQHLDCPQLT